MSSVVSESTSGKTVSESQTPSQLIHSLIKAWLLIAFAYFRRGQFRPIAMFGFIRGRFAPAPVGLA
jgi:hypothetical protein